MYVASHRYVVLKVYVVDFQGKTSLLSLTTGTSEEWFSRDGIKGDLRVYLAPIHVCTHGSVVLKVLVAAFQGTRAFLRFTTGGSEELFSSSVYIYVTPIHT